MNSLLNDFSYALRQLARKPGFTVLTVLTLALGVGANVAVFSLLNGYFLKPLPYPHGSQLVSVYTRLPKFYATQDISVSAVMYEAIRSRVTAFSAITAARYDPFNIQVNGTRARYVAGADITGDMFGTLDVAPVLGRELAAADDRPGNSPVAVIGFFLWKNLFHGNRAVIGEPVELNGKPYRIVGVMPEGFRFPNGHTSVWIPYPITPARAAPENTFNSWLGGFIGRLRPGVSREMLRTQLGYVQSRLLVSLPDTEREKYAGSGFHFATASYREDQLAGQGPHLIFELLLLQAAALLVLLLVSANVSNLLLARFVGRMHEIAVRRTLGATRLILVRQLLVEGLCLAIPGALVGAALGWLCVRFMVGSPLNPVTSLFSVSPDWRVGVYVLVAVCLITGLISGLPAVFLRKTDLNRFLQEGGHAQAGGRAARRARSALVITQIMLATALLVWAGLLVHSFINLQTLNVGFNPDHVLAIRMLKNHRVKRASGSVSDAILARVESLPGVEQAALTSWVPLNDFFGEAHFKLRGRAPFSNPAPTVSYDSVTPSFFRTLGMPILQGRGFDAGDTKATALVAVVDSRFAERFFSNRDAVGQEVNLGEYSNNQWVRIVGVTRPIKLESLEKPPPFEVYLSNAQIRYDYGQGLRLLVRTKFAPSVMMKAVEHAVAQMAPDIAVYAGTGNIYAMNDLIGRKLLGQQMLMLVVLAFGGVALALSIIGVYGVVSYSVVERRREFGIRLALGAEPRNIQRLVLWHGLKLLSVGVILGLMLAVAVAFEVSSLLFHVVPYDPAVLVVAAVTLGVTTVLSCYLPVTRMVKLDVVDAIQEKSA